MTFNFAEAVLSDLDEIVDIHYKAMQNWLSLHQSVSRRSTG